MAILRFIFICVFSFIILPSAYAARHFIIDTDMGGDDVIGILYLLQRPDIQVDAITIVGNGEARCKPAMHNLSGILQLMKRQDIPFACDNETPMAGQHRFPSVLTEDQEQLSGANVLLPAVPEVHASLSAVDLMINTLEHSKEPVEMLAIGPLTNIAKALQKAPRIKSQIKMLYISGGAVRAAGNIQDMDPQSANETAEWNIYIDPVAADIVFQQGLPLTLIPLDVTHQVPMRVSFFKRLEKTRGSKAADFVYALLKANLKWIEAKKFYFWDPLAAVIASDTSLAQFESLPLKINLGQEQTTGTTMIDKIAGKTVHVATAVNKTRFKTLLLSQLNQPSQG